MKAYKFLRNDMRSGYGDEPAWREGETRTAEGEPELCRRGYHSSPNWYDALSYAKGNIACIVDVSEPTQKYDDKQVSYSCTILKARNAEKVLLAWGCDCSERALTAAGVTDERRQDAWNGAWAAAQDAALEVARSAAQAAWDAAARADAWAAVWDAARDTAQENAWAAEVKWQRQHLDELMNKLFEEGYYDRQRQAKRGY